MNIKSAELLQGALQNAAENALRNREIQQSGNLEAQRIAVDNAFRQAQMAHYNQVENRQQDFYNREQDQQNARELLDSQNVARQQQLSEMAQSQGILKTILGLNATGQLTSTGIQNANHWLATDPRLSKSGIQIQAPASPSKDPSLRQSALRDWITLRQEWQGRVNSAADPAQRAGAQKILDGIDASVLGKSAMRGSRGASENGPDSISSEQEDSSDGTDNATEGVNSLSSVTPFGFATGGNIKGLAAPMTSNAVGAAMVTRPSASGAATLIPAAPQTPGLGVSATNSNGMPTGRLVKDNSGMMWNYTGNAADPRSDLNPANWQQAQQPK